MTFARKRYFRNGKWIPPERKGSDELEIHRVTQSHAMCMRHPLVGRDFRLRGLSMRFLKHRNVRVPTRNRYFYFPRPSRLRLPHRLFSRGSRRKVNQGWCIENNPRPLSGQLIISIIPPYLYGPHRLGSRVENADPRTHERSRVHSDCSVSREPKTCSLFSRNLPHWSNGRGKKMAIKSKRERSPKNGRNGTRFFVAN